jgi:hypothetical protein
MQRAIMKSYIKVLWPLVTTHFIAYSNVKKQVTQLIQLIVWKVVYNDHVIAYPNSPFHEDTLKD